MGIELMKKQKSVSSGFTIIELLIVTVIIAALAVLTFVALAGIQTRARNSAAQITASTFTRKARAYYTLTKSYPTNPKTVIADLSTHSESSLGEAEITLGQPTVSNGTQTLRVELCGHGAGMKITPFNYLTGALSGVVINLGDVSGDCAAATA
jgi:prepilin-type N-terminal cleavage/methylation domain-containing protein